MDDQQRASDDLTVARHALISAVAGYAGMLLIMIAVHQAVSRRDQLTRAVSRARRCFRPAAAAPEIGVLEEMRTSLDEITHADLSDGGPR